ncbi:uncharacterized protein LOC122638805 [Telopea speciosissima]|uniref:uncharacterized protein LOC122638805 n=1 Tax=Telopea speciosissima TaxID=54955 RepID=UPI001CC51E4C|nr:uncharacterized protein LOC122638805 [Telopea speciosissima]
MANALSRKSQTLSITSLVVSKELVKEARRMDLELLVEDVTLSLATLSVQSTLVERIQSAQASDERFKEIIKAIQGDTQGRLCVPKDDQLRKELLSEANDYPYSIHPEWKWAYVTMDFITGLPCTPRGVDALWVIVDRLTKIAHFIPIKVTYSIDKLARLYIDNVVCLQGVPVSIILDRDPRFTSKFWGGFQRAMGTLLSFSTTFHPQTDGQSKRTIQTLEDMLRACTIDIQGYWDEHVSLIEFAYNNSYQPTIGMAPFEAQYGRSVILHLAYRLALPPSLDGVYDVFHVSMLQKYVHDPSNVLSQEPPKLAADMSYKEVPEKILDSKVVNLCNRPIH